VSTVGTTIENTVDVKSGAGTASVMLGMAASEQHDAQALHFCWSPWPAFAGEASVFEAAACRSLL
jgi:hypothetical protein